MHRQLLTPPPPPSEHQRPLVGRWRRGRRWLATAFAALMLSAVLAAVPPPASADTGSRHPHFFARSIAVLGYEGAAAEITLMRTLFIGDALTFSIAYSDATDGFSTTADLTSAPTTFTIPAGQSEATLSIQIAADSVQEPDESVTMTFTTTDPGYHPLHLSNHPLAPEATNEVLLTIPTNKYFRVGNAVAYENTDDVELPICISTPAGSAGVTFTIANNLGSGATASPADVRFTQSEIAFTGDTLCSVILFDVLEDSDNSEETETFTVTVATTASGWEPYDFGDSIGDRDTGVVTIWSHQLKCHEFPWLSVCNTGGS